MLDIRPTTAPRPAPPVYAVQSRDNGAPDEEQILDAVPYHELNQEPTGWVVPLDDEATPDAAFIQAVANYYRGAFVDIVA